MLCNVSKKERNSYEKNIKNYTNAETNDEQQVKKVIEQFFNNQLESISTFKAVDNSSIVVDKDFKKYADIKNKLLASWYKKI